MIPRTKETSLDFLYLSCYLHVYERLDVVVLLNNALILHLFSAILILMKNLLSELVILHKIYYYYNYYYYYSVFTVYGHLTLFIIDIFSF